MAMKKNKQGSHTVDELRSKGTGPGFSNAVRAPNKADGAHSDAAPCPCGLGQRYTACCGRWHEGAERLQAPTAEALMRSRYSAFVKENAQYLLDTWHVSTRPAALDFEPGLKWLGLEVKSHTPQGDEAEVEFVARARQKDGRAFRQRERSRFLRESGQWFYVAANPSS